MRAQHLYLFAQLMGGCYLATLSAETVRAELGRLN